MITPNWLAQEHFDLAVEALPLVSVDLCLVCDGKLLLGRRNNRPPRGGGLRPVDEFAKVRAGILRFNALPTRSLV